MIKTSTQQSANVMRAGVVFQRFALFNHRQSVFDGLSVKNKI
jgi:ABC-type polar amino acid transport system ATPase subunit